MRERIRELEQEGAPKGVIHATELRMMRRMEQFNELAARVG
ncbi:hypothetical protein [Ottowia sp.]|nr:hypothetical protein [Ottowia sp.]